jgi:hypothetical protein
MRRLVQFVIGQVLDLSRLVLFLAGFRQPGHLIRSIQQPRVDRRRIEPLHPVPHSEDNDIQMYTPVG